MPEYKSPQSEPGMDKNVLLIFLVMAIAIFGAQFFMRKYAPAPQQTSNAKPAQQPVPSGVPSTPETSPATQPAIGLAQKTPGSKTAAVQPVTKQAASESETVIENGLYRITFTNRGA